ncbi:MAG: hypothetical protein LBE83_06810 [Propionibacteriaceae bacterium]|nr:hypothetical protein [Propionibacteriaceae bacterium]
MDLTSDDRLLVRARSDDRDAITELWNRYYAAAALAAKTNPSADIKTTKALATSFLEWIDIVGKQQTQFNSFISRWFAVLGTEGTPAPERRAAAWAFYSLDVPVRTTLWRYYVDAWETSQIADELQISPDQWPGHLWEAEGRFTNYLTLAEDVLEVTPDPDRMNEAVWIGDVLLEGVLNIPFEDFERYGNPLDSDLVIDPPALFPVNKRGNRRN